MRRSLPILVLASLCVVSTAQATTYMRVEKDGTKTYSDRPIPGGEPIDAETRAGLLGARAIGNLEPAARAAGTAGQFQLPELHRYARERFDVHQSRNGAHRAGDEPQSASWRYRDHDGRRSIRGAARHHELHMTAPVNRGTHTVSVTITDQYGKIGVHREFGVPCHASRVELPGRSEPTASRAAASHATLTTACTAGGQHGG